MSEDLSERTASKGDPWFDDGNVIFICEGASRFRVHIGVMTRNSEFFRNLFADAVNPNSSQDCPTVEIQDSAADFQNLLFAIYDQVVFDTGNIDGFLHLSSLLRMATKYLIGWLRKMAIEYLCKSWPVTIQAWESFNHEMWRPHPALLINLAHETDAPIFLPVAFCILGQLPVDEALKANLHSSTGPIDGSAYRLSLDDTYNYIRYQERRGDLARSLHAIIVERCRTCTKLRGPKDVRHLLLETLVKNDNPLIILNTFWEDFRCVGCDGCGSASHRNATQRVVDMKKQLWGKLPSWFDLEDWGSLRGGEFSSYVDVWPKESLGPECTCDTIIFM